MNHFIINGYSWRVKFVNPRNPMLVDRTGEYKLATTDPHSFTIYVSNEIHDNLLNKVLTHELGHCVIFSYDLLSEIHRLVHPRYWMEAEEWICNFVADYGYKIFEILDRILPDRFYKFIA